MMDGPVLSSFRDPSGFLFYQERALYRQINMPYKDDYDHLVNSGLHQSLVESNLLIPHEEVLIEHSCHGSYKIIKPVLVPFISYPYEWCFSQLKDAALATLRIQRRALDFGMSLKDCSAYNIQFRKGVPVLIDTLSFERYREGEPWSGYRQFCQHFVAPLALMSYTDVRLNQLLRVYIDGVPLDLATSLLPFHAYSKLSLFFHVYLHARSQKHYARKSIAKNLSQGQFGIRSLRGLIDNLETAIEKLTWRSQGAEWATYYAENATYTPSAMEHKRHLIAVFLAEVNPKAVWDLGANTGVFSRIAADKDIPTVSFDADPTCVEINYQTTIAKGERNILPLLLDLTNPSPPIGWDNHERLSLVERGPVDTVLALALIHHLTISNNVPLARTANFFGKICTSLVIEFVPKRDSQVQMLLANRNDIFPNYTQQAFEHEFSRFFTIQRSVRVKDSERTLYLMKRRQKDVL